MTSVFAAVGRFCVRFRWVILVVWLGGAAATWLLPSLSSVTQSDNTAFLPPSAQSEQAVRLAGPLVTAGATTVTVVLSRSPADLTPTDRLAVSQLIREMATVAHVVAVRGASFSPDAQAEQFKVLALLNTSGGLATQEQKSLVSSLRRVMHTARLPSGLESHLAGMVAARVDSNATSSGVSGRVQDISLLFVVLLLAVVFRSVLAPLVAVAPPIVVVFTAGRLTAEASMHGLQVSAIASLLQIVLVIGAGTDYALFLMFRAREGLAAGRSPHAAVAEAVARVGEPVAFSAGTVIAAVLSTLAATFRLYSALAVPLAIGVGLMLLAGLTLVPAALALLGPAVFWPGGMGSRGRATAGGWGTLATRIVRHPVTTLVAGTLVLGLLALASPYYTAAGLGSGVTPPPGSDSAAGDPILSAHFPQTSIGATVIVFRFTRPVWTDPSVLATGQLMLAADRQFTAVSGPLDPSGLAMTPARFAQLYTEFGPSSALPASPPVGKPVPGGLAAYQAYRASGQYVSADGRIAGFTVALAAGAPGTTVAAQAVPAIRADAARAGAAMGAIASGVIGQEASNYDIAQISDRDLHAVIPIAVAVIAVLLALVIRSVVAPLYLIASIVLSYFAALGLTVLIFMKVLGQSGISFILPFLLFIFLLALGEDYNILVMTRIREEARNCSLRDAIARALEATGTTVTSAGLVLAGTFGVLAFVGSTGSDHETVVDAGVGLALGILMDTFAVRTLLVPSVVALLGSANWWPSPRPPRDPQVNRPKTSQELKCQAASEDSR